MDSPLLVRVSSPLVRRVNEVLSYLVVFVLGCLIGIALTHNALPLKVLTDDIDREAAERFDTAVKRELRKLSTAIGGE